MSTIIQNKTNFALGTPSTANSVLTTSWTQFNNASVSLNCSGDRPVWIRLLRRYTGLGDSGNGVFILYFNQSAGVTTSYGFRLKVDGSVERETLYSQYMNVANTTNSTVRDPNFVSFIVFPTAGNHTFTIEGIGTNIPGGRSSGIFNASGGQCQIIATEL